jgi:PAS domain S-box-containing protein
MIGFRRPGLIVASGLLAVLLLLAEYWLLQNGAVQRNSERLSQWGVYSLNSLNQRLQSALDFTALRIPDGRTTFDARYLSDVASATVQPGTLFNGVALVQEISDPERSAFETNLSHSIQLLSNHHRINSPARNRYFPVVNYLPDNSNSLPQGLDVGAINGWERAFDQARLSKKPVLVGYREQDIANSRLMVIAAIPNSQKFLVFNLDKERFLNLQLPNGDLFIHQLRLIAWEKDSNAQPILLLDSHPERIRPTEAPTASLTIRPGEMEILLGTYSLNRVDPFLHQDSEFAALALSASSAILLLAILYWLAYRNNLFKAQLTRQNNQLEKNNHILRQQISERIRSEQARSESEMRQRAILQASSDAILLIDHTGTITDINPSAARLIGQSAEALARLPISALFSELYDSTRERDFESVATNFEGMPFEAQLIRGDASTLAVELSLSRVVLPDDRFFLVVCRDISIRKEQEAALIRLKNSLAEQVEIQSRQLAALLDASPLAMAYIVDRHLKQVNHAFLDLFDCSESKAINFTTRQFFLSDEQYERTGRLLYRQLNEGLVVTTELQLQTGHNDHIWCRLHGKALNPSVPGLGTIWLYQNFSDDRAAEDALRAAKDLAEESSRTKTEFLANMSHELRTPMHAILGFAEMGKSRAELAHQDKIKQYFQRILSSGNRLLSLLNDLLDLAKMEVGKMEYHIVENDLGQHLQEICDEHGFLAEGQGIHLDLICQPTPLLAAFDDQRLGQVIRNLLSNAIKFSVPGGHIQLSAVLMPDSQPPQVRVTVTDHGPGIPAGELESIFDKFIQSSSTKTGAGGTGLGLAICREIIHAHQGEIYASNAPSGGAIFSFTLPHHLPYHPSEDEEHGA